MLNDQIILDEPRLAWADVEDERLFVVTSVLVGDDDPLLKPVFDIVDCEGLICTSHKRLPDTAYVHGQAIYRWFERA